LTYAATDALDLIAKATKAVESDTPGEWAKDMETSFQTSLEDEVDRETFNYFRSWVLTNGEWTDLEGEKQ